MAWSSFKALVALGAVAGLGVPLQACGDDGDSGGGNGAAGSGATDAGGMGAADGAGGASGGAGGDAAGGTSGGGAVECGGETCQGATVIAFSLAACCTADDKCGVDVTAVLTLGGGAAPNVDPCVERDQVGKLDSNCPSQSVSGFLQQGCCRPDNKCGVNVTLAPLGCVDPSTLGTALPDGGAITSVDCDYDNPGTGGGGDAGGGADAGGGDDAGGSDAAAVDAAVGDGGDAAG